MQICTEDLQKSNVASFRKEHFSIGLLITNKDPFSSFRMCRSNIFLPAEVHFATLDEPRSREKERETRAAAE